MKYNYEREQSVKSMWFDEESPRTIFKGCPIGEQASGDNDNRMIHSHNIIKYPQYKVLNSDHTDHVNNV